MTISPQAYSKKESTYFDAVRTDVLGLLPPRMERVLEIGCGTGDTLAYLRSTGRCTWAAGVELYPGAASIARGRIDRLWEGNVETLQLDLEADSLDAILCLDVLEHLIDPWAVISKLGLLLKPGGALIASIPNVRNHKVLFPLLFRGRWDYTDSGLLDRTHLRFFVRET